VSLQSNGLAHLHVNSVDFGIWDVSEGGETTAEVVKHRPGGSTTEKIYKAPRTHGPVTLRRVYENGRDQAIRAQLRPLVGNGDSVVGLQDLDANMNPFGTVATGTGVLSSLKPPERDSASNEKAMIEVIVEIENWS
jgi:hypothetical protein